MGGTLTSPFVEWQDTWDSGIASVDAEHKQIVLLINDLNCLMGEAGSREAVEQTIAQMVIATSAHFEREEDLMQRHGYPEYAQHKLEHLKLIIQLTEFQKLFAAGTVALTIPVMDYLRKWFLNHLTTADLQYVGFLKDNGFL